MIQKIMKCRNCNLCRNQLPLLDNKTKADAMLVGLSAQKLKNNNTKLPFDKNTNSGKIIDLIENSLPNVVFYKTNLVKCLPLDENKKLRYPTMQEMENCVNNLMLEIEEINPKIIYALGREVYNFIFQNMNAKSFDKKNLVYIEHPSYIYIYKRKFIGEYINKIKKIYNDLVI